MKVHKITFAESGDPGIWAAVSMAKHEHRNAMRYKRDKSWSLYGHCRETRDTMLHTIRIIARGLLANMERHNRKAARL